MFKLIQLLTFISKKKYKRDSFTKNFIQTIQTCTIKTSNYHMEVICTFIWFNPLERLKCYMRNWASANTEKISCFFYVSYLSKVYYRIGNCQVIVLAYANKSSTSDSLCSIYLSAVTELQYFWKSDLSFWFQFTKLLEWQCVKNLIYLALLSPTSQSTTTKHHHQINKNN